MFFQRPHLNRNKRKFQKLRGLTPDYPKPENTTDLLFYIQRNHNWNTVIYKLNRTATGEINTEIPMHIQWIMYNKAGEIEELTFLQNKLAYGCEYNMINNESFEFHFVSFPEMQFFLAKRDTKFSTFYRRDGKLLKLSNVYVHADEFGLFPDVKFIEFYGIDVKTGKNVQQTLRL